MAPGLQRSSVERLAAWLVTGPAGHFWSAAADITLIWTRYGRYRALRALGVSPSVPGPSAPEARRSASTPPPS